jgi:hypothetical protein
MHGRAYFCSFLSSKSFFCLAEHLLVNNTDPPNTPRPSATDGIGDVNRLREMAASDQDVNGPRSCPDLAARSGQRTELSYQLAARDEEEEQETSLPLDFGDSLPPRLTPLADKQFRYGKGDIWKDLSL